MSITHAHPPIVVSHEGGATFAAQIRSHRILVDQSVRGGGHDSAPSPIELLGASLGTCVALYVNQFCVARDLPTSGLHVEVSMHAAIGANRIGKFAVHVIVPAELSELYGTMLERVVRSCPAHNTLSHGAEVEVLIESAVGVG